MGVERGNGAASKGGFGNWMCDGKDGDVDDDVVGGNRRWRIV